MLYNIYCHLVLVINNLDLKKYSEKTLKKDKWQNSLIKNGILTEVL
jgi:hypothetical protein